MSIGKQMSEQLRLLAAGAADPPEWLSKAADYSIMAAEDDAQRGSLEFFDHDRYSVALRALAIGGGAPAPDDARAFLSAHAAEIARSMSYLEEPLAVWELDDSERLAQLRSSPPLREGDEVSYWEVTLQAGPEPGARLTRYRWRPGLGEREIVAYPATFALVARMADSLAAALRS